MIYRFADCEFDDALYQLRRAGEIVALEPQVYRLLAYLLTHRDRVVSRSELFEQLWPGQVVGDAALTYCVGKARKAVDDTGTSQRVIKTVHGHGYRFIAEVRSTEAYGTIRLPEVAVAPESILVPLPSPSDSAPLPVSAVPDRTQVIWPLMPVARQRRQLTVVGCLFVCGWLASLWQWSTQSPWTLAPQPSAVLHISAEVPTTEAMPCRWWILSSYQQPARDAVIQGWMAAARTTPGAITEARWQFQRAIDLDPTYAAAYASLGVLAWQDWLSWSPDAKSLEQAALYLQKAATLDSSCPQVVILLSKVLSLQRRQAQAMAEAERHLRPAPLPFAAAASLTLPPRGRTSTACEEDRVLVDTIQ